MRAVPEPPGRARAQSLCTLARLHMPILPHSGNFARSSHSTPLAKSSSPTLLSNSVVVKLHLRPSQMTKKQLANCIARTTTTVSAVHNKASHIAQRIIHLIDHLLKSTLAVLSPLPAACDPLVLGQPQGTNKHSPDKVKMIENRWFVVKLVNVELERLKL